MDSESNIRTQVAISFLPRLNRMAYKSLFERCGGAESFFRESFPAREALLKEYGVFLEAFNPGAVLQQADEELSRMDKYDIHICSFEDRNYPELLEQCTDAPLVFFYKGLLKWKPGQKWLAVVGTRRASVRCKQLVDQTIKELGKAEPDLIIVSGLAYGIDASAHRASLQGGLTTWAVLGNGLASIYPASHQDLARSILESGGGVISEYPCQAPVFKDNFLQRNRIVAGLCQGVLVAESAVKGGSMSTARIALSYNREVMTFPGRPEEAFSAGCNLLIKSNVAALVENAKDIAQILNIKMGTTKPYQTSLDLFEADQRETPVLQVLNTCDSMHIDLLSQQTQIPVNELSALLLQMELEGKVVSLPGKNYMKG